LARGAGTAPLSRLALMGVLAGLVAGCAVIIPFVLAASAWLDRREARRMFAPDDGAPPATASPVEPPTPIADEVEAWLRDRG
jgi:uncharacterized iron-regulated membrane protein